MGVAHDSSNRSPPHMASPPRSPLPHSGSTPALTFSDPHKSVPSSRPLSFARNRLSGSSRLSTPRSRPASHAFPIFHSSLPYALVRDFAYPTSHPCHYGPPVPASGAVSAVSTPASESQSHFSDLAPKTSDSDDGVPQHLPSLAFGDGPPYSEDEDLHSPIVMTSRHRKHKAGSSGQFWEDESPLSPHATSYPLHSTLKSPNRPLELSPQHDATEGLDVPDEDESCYSKDYQFTIASADEEMHGKAVALFDFAKENENELPLVEGQVIWVSYRHGQGWLVAQDPRTGDAGLVPEEYVRLLRDIEGGLGSLHSPDAPPEGEESVDPVESPGTQEHSAGQPTHSAKSSSGSNSLEKGQAVLSSFSTSSNDLHPYPHPIAGKQAGQPPPLVTHYSGTTQRSPLSASDSPHALFDSLSPVKSDKSGQ